jgi:hypothetical protein
MLPARKGADQMQTPSLVDLLQVVGSVGLVAGGCLGFLWPATGGRQIAENVALGAAVGGVVGGFVAFAIYAGIAI